MLDESLPYSHNVLVSVLFFAVLHNLTDVAHNETDFPSPVEHVCAQFVKLASCTSAQPDLVQRLDAPHQPVCNCELRNTI